MPKFLLKRWHGYPVIALFVTSVVLVSIITYFQWMIGMAGFVVLGGLFYYAMRAEAVFQEELGDYISTLSHRLKKVGEEALMEMPIGIILYDEDFKIEWANPYMGALIEEESFIGHSLNHVSEELIPYLKSDAKEEVIKINTHKFQVNFKKEDRLLYFFDVTEQLDLERLYDEEQTVMAIIYLDNYDEVTQGLDDQFRSTINSKVTSVLNAWANANGIFLKRTSSERFLAVFNQRILNELEKNKFSVLDEVRESTAKQNVSLTLSIGVAAGTSSLPELGQLAQSSLDLALGRGGDQVAIKQTNGKVRFYGGKTNPVEKRTRVRARVISHALSELVADSDKVMIMGHKNPDMDSIGSAIGILKVAQVNGKDGYVVLDQSDIDIGVQRLMDEIKETESVWKFFITPEEAMEIATRNTLLVVVDTHKPSMVIEEKLLSKLDHVVVIDHHRRGEEFIKDPVLVYMEPYASSTAELVTELLEYQPKRLKMRMLEATALLAGIIVDTKSFTLRTGSRTFDAASYLRAHGADTILVQKFLKEDLVTYTRRSKLIESAEIYKKGIVIAKSTPEDAYNQVVIAQAADILLSMNGIQASFVISNRIDGKVSISARSLGDINVQMIMEQLEGGGHLTNAACQIENSTIDEAERQLKQIIDEYIEGGEEE
ncbi:DHH family phosphoesterase [Fictibacillus phosphorivorans]|uniref:DHH family phosphoesterase n=1 Tax=Fictibacillus phosphorivorans TaxID=1221500 RepID=UPI00203E455F|nr:DHH family phosphoesterase [Fictibacillus phosphorivorans]MCM3720135.1 DHH family phosphoesterase [Fictibacillus phosphorivorans]MCM3777801.1 DHH family phosphoesterase [Fictibacillus phosphorivorans]